MAQSILTQSSLENGQVKKLIVRIVRSPNVATFVCKYRPSNRNCTLSTRSGNSKNSVSNVPEIKAKNLYSETHQGDTEIRHDLSRTGASKIKDQIPETTQLVEARARSMGYSPAQVCAGI